MLKNGNFRKNDMNFKSLVLALIFVLIEGVSAKSVMLSSVKILPAEDGMVLIEFAFQNGFPDKYKVAFSDEDENSLLTSLHGVGYEDKELWLAEELNSWMKVAKTEIKGVHNTIVNFELQRRVPFKSEFKEGKLYLSFADVRYTNTVRTVLLTMAIPIALLFTFGAYLLIEK